MTWGILLDVYAAVIYASTTTFVAVRPPPRPLRPVLLQIQIAALIWILGDLATLVVLDPTWEVVSIIVLYSGSLVVPALWWQLAFGFAELNGIVFRWASPRVVRAPLLAAFVMWLALLSNSWHGQFLTPVVGARNEYHWMWYASVSVLYLSTLGVLGIYLSIYRQLPPTRGGRGQCLMMIAATLSCLVTNAAYTLAPVSWPFDLTIFGGLLTGILFIGGVYSQNVVDLPPFAVGEVLRNDPTGLLLVQDDGTLAYANPQAQALLGGEPLLLEHPASEVLASRLLRPDSQEAQPSTEEIERDFGKAGFRGALFRVAGTGSNRWLWFTATQLEQRAGRANGLAVRIRDVSPLRALADDQRAMAEQLRQAEDRRSTGVLTAGTAHEINNPLGSVLISAQFALSSREEASDPEQRLSLAEEALTVAVEETSRARSILENMLRFSRNDSADREPGDPNEAIRRARALTSDFTHRLQAEVVLALAEPLPPVRHNAAEMEQVFVNLIQNAAQSGGKGRCVRISTEAADGWVRAAVRDDGPGMTPAQIAHAFEPFRTSRRELGRTGLGLSVVHGIVDAHSGRVRIESEIGHGTCVLVELPAARGADT